MKHASLLVAAVGLCLAPSAARAQTGTLVISMSGPGCEVQVDGQPSPGNPAREDLIPGSHLVLVSCGGTEVHNDIAEVTAGRSTVIQVRVPEAGADAPAASDGEPLAELMTAATEIVPSRPSRVPEQAALSPEPGGWQGGVVMRTDDALAGILMTAGILTAIGGGTMIGLGVYQPRQTGFSGIGGFLAVVAVTCITSAIFALIPNPGPGTAERSGVVYWASAAPTVSADGEVGAAAMAGAGVRF